MLQTIQSILIPGKPRVTPIWNKVLFDVDARTAIYKQRFDKSQIVFTRCVNLLRYFALNVDLDYLITRTNDFDLWSFDIEPLVDRFKKLFDPVYTGKEEINMFVGRNQSTVFDIPEFLLNVSMTTPMLKLPFGKSWEDWKHVKPVRILYHDADELVSNLIMFSVPYKGMPPTRMIVSIDIALFFMKLIKYAQYVKAYEKRDIDVDAFIHHHIVSQWYNDLIQIWCMNLIEKVINTEDAVELKLVENTIYDPAIVSAALVNGIANINIEFEKLKQLNTNIEDFLATKWLNGRSYFDTMHVLLDDTALPVSRQYMYLRFLIDLPIVRFVVKLAYYRKEIGIVPRLHIMLLRKLELYERVNILSNIHSTRLRDVVQKELIELRVLIERLVE